MSRQVRVYRSARRQEMYLYVDIGEDLDRVPDALMKQFGRPLEVMELELHAGKKLARAEAAVVLERIASDGFFLQMPPSPDLETRW
jgi:uncharacterized protein YcgL (UPF0745 family)